MTASKSYSSSPPPFQQQRILLVIFLSLILISPINSQNPIPNLYLDITPLDAAKTGFSITADATTGGNFGNSATKAGDIDKDGYDDFIVTAYSNNLDTGIAYVFYGGPSSSFSSNTNLASIVPLNPTTTGFTIKGATTGEQFGYSVGTAGDVNKDGYADIIVGAPKKNSYQGAAYVIYGGPRSSFSNIDLSSTPLNPQTTGFTLTGNALNDAFGVSVATAGDIDNDGFDDIIIGAFGRNSAHGEVYMIYGQPKSPSLNINFGLASLNHLTTGFSIKGKVALDYLGRWVSTAGDINKDGFDDFIFGASGYVGNKGGAFVMYGGPRAQLLDVDLSTQSLVPGTTGFTITGSSANDVLGESVSTAGDVNKDGYDDIIVGASGVSSGRGAAYVIYGGPKASLLDIDLSLPLSNTKGFTITGNTPGDNLGYPVSAAGDINNDGYDDVIIGVYQALLGRGAACLIYGGPKSSLQNIDLILGPLNPQTTGFILTGNALNDAFGISVATAGDIDNDGFDDIIIGASAKNGYAGTAYLINAKCPTAHCTSCISRTCQSCDLGYGLTATSLCDTCPEHCYQCNYAAKCDDCNSPYLLYQSWCLPDCPVRTFSFNNKCQDCPSFCSSCTSLTSCQTCDKGYKLFNSLCVPSSSPEAKAAQAVSSGVRGISSAVNIGSAASPMTALVSKIVQNTRYLNLSVTDELIQVYQTWNTELISWNVPNVITKFDHFKTSPEEFSRYDVDSSFLANFWPTLMTILVSLAILVTFYAIQKGIEGANVPRWVSFIVQKFVAGSFNFALVQAYGCFDDILFYLILDFKANPFNTFFCWASFFCALGFLALGCFLVFFNMWKVRQYQRIKNNTTDKEAFNERNKKWELFYSDFNDEDLWSQSGLAVLVVRSSLSSTITTTLYDYPIMQTAFFIIMDGALIFFLYFKNPFSTLRGRLAQYYFEAITLMVHLCTFLLALQDTFPHSSSWLRTVLSTGIIYLNTALISGSLGFLFIEIYKTISQKQREARKKQPNNSIQEDTMEAQSIISHPQSAQKIFPSMHRLDSVNYSQENSHTNRDDHFLAQIHTNHRIPQPRVQKRLPLMQNPHQSTKYPKNRFPS